MSPARAPVPVLDHLQDVAAQARWVAVGVVQTVPVSVRDVLAALVVSRVMLSVEKIRTYSV